MKTMDYLERVRALNGGCSDYRLAQLLEIKQQSMSKYRHGEREMDDEIAVRVAHLLNIPAMRVVADIKAARAQADGQIMMVDFWREAARAAAGVVMPMPRKHVGRPAMASAEAGKSRKGRLRKTTLKAYESPALTN